MTNIVVIVALWFIFGFMIIAIWSNEKNADGFELCNPYWAYHYHKSVNWIGATMLSLLYTAFCPIGALCYWFYKLCTIGRR